MLSISTSPIDYQEKQEKIIKLRDVPSTESLSHAMLMRLKLGAGWFLAGKPGMNIKSLFRKPEVE